MSTVTCAGGAVLDRLLRLYAPVALATSNPAGATTSHGGVARNVAENLARLGVRVRLCSRLGDDDGGRELRGRLGALGVDLEGVTVARGVATAQYVAVLDPAGELVLGVAAMDVFDSIRADAIDQVWPEPPGWLFLDCNLPPSVLAAALARARSAGTPVAVDTVSAPKATRLAGMPDRLAGITVLFCTRDEAGALLAGLSAGDAGRPPDDAVLMAGALLDAGADACVMTLGDRGAIVVTAAGIWTVPARRVEVVDVTGAGDALLAGTLSKLVVGLALPDAVRFGTEVAALTVASAASVRPDLALALAAGVESTLPQMAHGEPGPSPVGRPA